MTADQAAARQASVDNTHTELLHELERAHVIIRNALLIMSPCQLMVWTERNARDGVAGSLTPRPMEAEMRAEFVAAVTFAMCAAFMALGAYLHHQAIKRVVDDCLKDQTHD